MRHRDASHIADRRSIRCLIQHLPVYPTPLYPPNEQFNYILQLALINGLFIIL